MWRALLPAAVERARQSYMHTTECIYSKPDGCCETNLCNCGRGKDLPPDFNARMRSIEVALDVNTTVQSLFYRAALSPLYIPTEIESVAMQTKLDVAPVRGSSRCAKCGAIGEMFRCSRCRKAMYCSKDCQRNHWKIHKPTCSKQDLVS